MREVTVTEVAEVLDAAVDLYESGTYGWVQGKYLYAPPGETPRRCMLAILDTATYETVRKNMATYNRVLPEVVDAISAEIGNIPSWNDTPDRTLDDVIEILKSVAKDLRNTQ